MIERLTKIINKVDPAVSTDGLSETTRLKEDLKFDSLAMMMMSMEIEEEFGFKFTEFVKFETVGDVCRYIEEKVK
ncbi:MAG: acyl carrier protein [Clostridia bacterium]|nr:acyl carrier protein [Clostridia bacterium]